MSFQICCDRSGQTEPIRGALSDVTLPTMWMTLQRDDVALVLCCKCSNSFFDWLDGKQTEKLPESGGT
jgi:hypothetical protein